MQFIIFLKKNPKHFCTRSGFISFRKKAKEFQLLRELRPVGNLISVKDSLLIFVSPACLASYITYSLPQKVAVSEIQTQFLILSKIVVSGVLRSRCLSACRQKSQRVFCFIILHEDDSDDDMFHFSPWYSEKQPKPDLRLLKESSGQTFTLPTKCPS